MSIFGTLLVYGTLRPGLGDTVTLSGYKMYDVGWFPGIVGSNDLSDTIVCERVEVKDEDHLRALDRYEGYYPDSPNDSLYFRKKVGDDWLYVYNSVYDEDKQVPDGDWLEHKNQLSGVNSQLAEKEPAL